MESDEEKKSKMKAYKKREWLQKLQAVKVYESDMHNVIMNYLTVNGYQEAAEAFYKETNAKPEMPLQCIGRRKEIRASVLNGNMEEATELINAIDAQILTQNTEINFRLKQQQLLQLIEKGESIVAVEFAQKQLAPCVKQNPDLLPQLEETMSLLAFGDIRCKEAQKVLKDIEHHDKAAQHIDEVILDFYNIDQESILESIVKNLLFTQPLLESKASCYVPLLKDVSTGGIEQVEGMEFFYSVDEDSDSSCDEE